MNSVPWSFLARAAAAWLALHLALSGNPGRSAVPLPATSAAATGQIAELRGEIARHDALYFRQANPEITDSEYDGLKRRLAELEQAFPEAARLAPPLPGMADERTGLFRSYPHRQRMLSLDKCYTETELRAFDARLSRVLRRGNLEYVVEPKYDGVAVSVTYVGGKFMRALTRGNGAEGEDITEHVRQIPEVPRMLGAGPRRSPAPVVPGEIEVRGEVYVTFVEFARINAEREAAGEMRFASPRNLAAGTLRQLDPREVARRGLRVVFFGVGACKPVSVLPATQRELRSWFEQWKLPVVAQAWPARGPDELVAAVEMLRRARTSLEFPADGGVVKLDALSAQRESGDSETAPRWATAYKFAPDRAETRLLAITLQVGRTGVLTPVAELEPVELAGSTIARATLHNRSEIARRDIRVGDFVFVEKAGEVIPAVAGVNLERRPDTTRPYAFPAECPACGDALVQRDGEAAVRCTNAACPAQVRRRLEHFASKSGVDIDGLGPAIIDALVGRGAVKDLADLYRLRRGDLLIPGRSAGRSADQLLVAIEQSKRAELWRFIHGLGIPGVGLKASGELARRIGSLEALLAVTGTDPAARAVSAHFADRRNRATVAGLLAAGVRPGISRVSGPDLVLSGKTFVLTGTLPTLTRAQAGALIEEAGGRIMTSVSRTTTYVVAGAGAGTKLEQAHRLGIEVIDELALRRMLNPTSAPTAWGQPKENVASQSQR